MPGAERVRAAHARLRSAAFEGVPSLGRSAGRAAGALGAPAGGAARRGPAWPGRRGAASWPGARLPRRRLGPAPSVAWRRVAQLAQPASGRGVRERLSRARTRSSPARRATRGRRWPAARAGQHEHPRRAAPERRCAATAGTRAGTATGRTPARRSDRKGARRRGHRRRGAGTWTCSGRRLAASRTVPRAPAAADPDAGSIGRRSASAGQSDGAPWAEGHGQRAAGGERTGAAGARPPRGASKPPPRPPKAPPASPKGRQAPPVKRRTAAQERAVIHRTFRSLDEAPKLVGFTMRQWAVLIAGSLRSSASSTSRICRRSPRSRSACS